MVPSKPHCIVIEELIPNKDIPNELNPDPFIEPPPIIFKFKATESPINKPLPALFTITNLFPRLLLLGVGIATVFTEQGRNDLAEPELAEAAILEQFLPEALSEEEIGNIVEKTIADVGAEGMKDMGKVMGIVSKQLAGQADGKTISAIVKAKLA